MARIKNRVNHKDHYKKSTHSKHRWTFLLSLTRELPHYLILLPVALGPLSLVWLYSDRPPLLNWAVNPWRWMLNQTSLTPSKCRRATQYTDFNEEVTLASAFKFAVHNLSEVRRKWAHRLEIHFALTALLAVTCCCHPKVLTWLQQPY